jgi:2-dehydropantoate 2-reductase
MPVIRKVAILGAGAIGAYFGKSFFDSPEFQTSLIATGSRYDKLKNKGLVINGKPYLIPVINPVQAVSPVDLIIVALKQYHLNDAVKDLGNIIGESTTIVSFMNGLDSEEYIGSIYGMEKVLYGISVGIDATRQENRISYKKPGKHFFGEANNSQLSQRVLAVQEAFTKVGITFETPEYMIRTLWWKFMVNVGMNPASAVMRANYKVFQTNPAAQALMEALMKEVISFAEVMEINLTPKDIVEWYSFLHQLAPDGKTSMLQDIEAGRQTEIDTFCGKVVEMGKVHSIPTPVNQALLNIVHVLEGISV